ncbi:hypothetical protein [Actinomadura litoris]|uniref:Uncharacterized protein n=1 Tax=Actinomadura litoris TaxID=2678616 RepID=A0A7K1LAF6_9ACTN|nr:hypothetical protein [Actinomadura litoris]MUN41410.1 hypothetical protein [Actinomadura litoris]
MATLARTALTPVGAKTTGAAAGQDAGWAAATATTGDLIPLSGRGTILRIRTTGTACNAVIDSVVTSSYGADQDLTVTMGATDEQEVYIANDGRFDQGGGSKGYAKVVCSAVTGVSIAAKIVPG